MKSPTYDLVTTIAIAKVRSSVCLIDTSFADKPIAEIVGLPVVIDMEGDGENVRIGYIKKKEGKYLIGGMHPRELPQNAKIWGGIIRQWEI